MEPSTRLASPCAGLIASAAFAASIDSRTRLCRAYNADSSAGRSADAGCNAIARRSAAIAPSMSPRSSSWRASMNS